MRNLWRAGIPSTLARARWFQRRKVVLWSDAGPEPVIQKISLRKTQKNKAQFVDAVLGNGLRLAQYSRENKTLYIAL